MSDLHSSTPSGHLSHAALTSWLVGWTSGEARARARSHLTDCPECRRRLHGMRRELRTGGLTPQHPPDSLLALWEREPGRVKGFGARLLESHIRECSRCHTTFQALRSMRLRVEAGRGASAGSSHAIEPLRTHPRRQPRRTIAARTPQPRGLVLSWSHLLTGVAASLLTVSGLSLGMLARPGTSLMLSPTAQLPTGTAVASSMPVAAAPGTHAFYLDTPALPEAAAPETAVSIEIWSREGRMLASTRTSADRLREPSVVVLQRAGAQPESAEYQLVLRYRPSRQLEEQTYSFPVTCRL